MSPHKVLITALLTMGLLGCIVKPNFEESYDHQCKITKKKITLSVEEVSEFGARNCRGNHECKAIIVSQFVTAGIVLPISAIVSGSIALVGNTIYWLQEDKC